MGGQAMLLGGSAGRSITLHVVRRDRIAEVGRPAGNELRFRPHLAWLLETEPKGMMRGYGWSRYCLATLGHAQRLRIR